MIIEFNVNSFYIHFLVINSRLKKFHILNCVMSLTFIFTYKFKQFKSRNSREVCSMDIIARDRSHAIDPRLILQCVYTNTTHK